MIQLPYEAIGKATVAVLAALVLVAIALVLFVALYALWWRGLSYLINLCWRGYDIHGEHPPHWRRTVAIYAHALRDRDFSKVDEMIEELDKREGRDIDD